MKSAILLAMISFQLIGQTTGSTPKVVYEEVTKTDPGLLPCHDFDAQIRLAFFVRPQKNIPTTTTTHRRVHETSHWHRWHLLQGQ
jgi:hypothetical protein